MASFSYQDMITLILAIGLLVGAARLLGSAIGELTAGIQLEPAVLILLGNVVLQARATHGDMPETPGYRQHFARIWATSC